MTAFPDTPQPSSVQRSVLVIILISCTLSLSSQEISFQSVPQPNRSSNTISSSEDSKGYLWFSSSNGLYRYDGYRYTSYFNNPEDTNSLSSNFTLSVHADRDGYIWVGTMSTGLDRLDPVTGIFKHFRADKNDTAGLIYNKINVIQQDKNGMIWVGTDYGLNSIDPKTFAITRYIHNVSDTSSLSIKEVRVIYEDRQGTLWIGTGAPYSENPTKEGGLSRFNRSKNNFTRYSHQPANSQSLIENRVTAIYEDSHNTFWVGTTGDGLHTMDRANGTFTRHLFDPAHPDKLSRPSLKETISWATDHITFITEDATGKLWIGTLENGALSYDYTTKKTERYPFFKNSFNDEDDVNATWATSTKDGVFWIGTWNGLFRADPLRKTIPFVYTGKRISCIYKDSTSDLWYGGYGTGLVRKDYSGIETRFVNDPHNPASITDNSIRSIYRDKHGVFWIGTEKGLNRFDKNKGTFSIVRINNVNPLGLNNDTASMILESRDGSLWFAIPFNRVVRINPKDRSQISYIPDPNNTNTISSSLINKFYEDREGNMWVGTYLGGLNKIDLKTGKITRTLDKSTVKSILEDAKGIMWIGTTSGLFRSDIQKEKFTLYHDPDKKISPNIAVGGVLEDSQKNLWLGTSEGILRIDNTREKLVFFRSGNDIDMVSFKSEEGELFFGDREGYFAFFPSKLAGNPRPPTIDIQTFRLDDKPVMVKDNGPLKQQLSQVNNIELLHDQNVFSFEFTGIHFSNPAQNKILYRLENYDNNWREGGEEMLASYYKVPPGKYIFHVRSANADRIWSQRSISIVINPPWWKTWQAYTGYALVAIAFVWLLIRFRVKSLKKQIAEQNRALQVEELSRQKTEMEMQALRAQMNPHFIFNSLNSINRFILQNNKDEASDYLSKFSRLIRLILNNSQASMVSLQNEIDSVQLYLELEALRFDHHFTFKINIAENIEPEAVMVPPLIIQPFVENSIWHGLMHKKEQGHLSIDVFEENDLLVCKIKDDGVGRKKAADIKSRSKTTYQSMGMKITGTRIDLLQQQKLNEPSIVINDLVLPDNTPAGTEVIIRLPLKYN
jgi:ligand-binding sensor domain-containing protein